MTSFAAGGGAQPSIEWQWNDDRRRWVDYDSASSGLIESAFMAGSPSVVVSSAHGGRAGTGATYNVFFSTMEQVNNATNFIRGVRRNVVLHGLPPYEQWEWKISSRWEAVPVATCFQIMTSRDVRRDSSTRTHVRGVAYDVDFTNMTVTSQSTGDVRPLRLTGERNSSPSVSGAAASAGAGAGARAVAGAVPGGGVATRSGASAASQQSNGSRAAEYQRVVNQATDCTATVGDNETCAVCIDGFSTAEPALLLSRCTGHYMHAPCILETFGAMGPKCPTCSTMYGPLHGEQPVGTMTVRNHRRGAMPLSGHEFEGTIVIQYSFPSGTQGPRHPNPGSSYHGTSRTAFLPDNVAGREVLALLKRSFEQQMTFTIGTSLTTGASNCVIWNGVHHKTSPSGGCASFGYPDPGYFGRVKMELAAKGIQ
ncbi:unnamed protein product [Pylaiella littoralis]